MGVEVDWRDVKKICPPSSNLGTFLGALCHFIKEIGQEHKAHFIKEGTPNALITTPVSSKVIFDLMHDLHPKTLVCTLLLHTPGKDIVCKLFERVYQMMALCEDRTPLHLKIQAWHSSNKRMGVSPGPPRLDNFKVLLMPRQHLLKAINPDFTKITEYVLDRLKPIH